MNLARGRDNTLLRATIMRLAAVYENEGHNTPGRSHDKEGKLSGPFVALVRGFFGLYPEPIQKALGINPESLQKAIRSALEEYNEEKQKTEDAKNTSVTETC